MFEIGRGLAHFIHFLGLGMILCGIIGTLVSLGLSASKTADEKKGIEEVAAALTTKIEVPGLFVAIVGGIIAVIIWPSHFNPKASGAGPWLHIKLLVVMIVLVLSHLKMFRTRKLVRERSGGASEADCEALRGKAQLFGKINLALVLSIMFLAAFRTVILG